MWQKLESLADDVGQQRHKACALNGLGDRALVGGAKVGAAARHNLAVRVNKLLEGLRVLVVDTDELGCVFFSHKIN